MKNFILKIIQFYQKCISPNLGLNCRFFPSCSEYTILAVNKYGASKGLAKGICRLLRCNQFFKGGIDLP